MALENSRDILVEQSKNYGRKLAAGIVAASCAIGMASALAATAKGGQRANKISSSSEFVGVSTNDIFTENSSDANLAAQQIENLGANAVRIFYPLNKGTAWENYHDKLCNAAQAAYSHNLQLIISFVGYDSQGHGYYPQSKLEVRQFATTAASIEWALASDKDASHPGGCVPQQKNLFFEGINEENYRYFNRYLSDKTPAQALAMNSVLATTLRKEASKPEIRAHITFAESLSAGNNSPVEFLIAEAQAEKNLGIDNPYNEIEIHPYPPNITDDPTAIMASLIARANPVITQSFSGSQLTFGEYGVNTTNPPLSIANTYTPPVSSNLGVSESTQVKYIRNYLKASAGMPMITLLDAKDDGGGFMPSSGEYYTNGQTKTSFGAIRYAIGKYTGR